MAGLAFKQSEEDGLVPTFLPQKGGKGEPKGPTIPEQASSSPSASSSSSSAVTESQKAKTSPPVLALTQDGEDHGERPKPSSRKRKQSSSSSPTTVGSSQEEDDQGRVMECSGSIELSSERGEWWMEGETDRLDSSSSDDLTISARKVRVQSIY